MRYRTLLVSVLSLVAFLAVVGCAGKAPLKKQHGNEYFTQVGMWAQDGEHLTTNYKSGRFIPVNTRIVLEGSSAKTIRFRVPAMGDYTATVVNVKQYTGETIKGIFKRTFGDKKVNLDRFSDEVYEAIREGEIQEGMSKQAVILARGYPPSHETPKLDSDTWKYWESRFGTVLVHFENGEVSKIEK